MSAHTLPVWNFAARTVVVTGAARGLGAAIAQAFLQAGAQVAALDQDGEVLAQRVAEWQAGTRCLAITVDVSAHDAVEAALAQTVSHFGALDGMVANAGIARRGPALEIGVADFDRVIEVNLNGLFYCNRLAARHMKPGGWIVNMASVMGFSGGIFPNAAYQASKGAVVNLTRALALEWAAQGLRVNGVAPAYVETPLTAPVLADPVKRAAVMAHAPLGRLPSPDDIAQAVLFLASDAAASITGQVLAVDSGYLAR